jgi:phosphohistidine phosphatase
MPERTLVLLRHAKSDQSSTEADIDRPLDPRGRRQAPETGRWLADNLDGIDLAVVSPANRARASWDLVSAELGQEVETRIDDRVYGASVAGLLGVVRELPDDAHTVVLVGHNPGFEDLSSLLTSTSVSLATSAVAVLDSDAAWSSADESWAVLRASGRPQD